MGSRQGEMAQRHKGGEFAEVTNQHPAWRKRLSQRVQRSQRFRVTDHSEMLRWKGALETMKDPSTQIYFHPLSLEHDTGYGHPERADRVLAVRQRLQSSGLEGLDWLTPRLATSASIATNHDVDYIASVAKMAGKGGGQLDLDTSLSKQSYRAALASAGSGIQAVNAVLKGEAKNAFSITRPPGHHALASMAMGFCLFNNIAIAARYAIAGHGLKRVFIFDWDVHHGNGTQDSFYDDPSVFFCSIHQSPLYPGTGSSAETGHGPGEGYTLNLPVPAGTGGDVYQRLMVEKVVPALHAFEPEIILISAGFDAHERDPLAGVLLTDGDFAMMTRLVLEAADRLCDGKVVALLEGGYDLQGLAGGSEQMVRALGARGRQ